MNKKTYLGLSFLTGSLGLLAGSLSNLSGSLEGTTGLVSALVGGLKSDLGLEGGIRKREEKEK